LAQGLLGAFLIVDVDDCDQAAITAPEASRIGAAWSWIQPRVPSPRSKQYSSGGVVWPSSRARASGNSCPSTCRPSGW